MADDASAELVRMPTQFTRWKIGVLDDAWDHPTYAKPVEVGAEDGLASAVTSYAIGDEAASYFAELKPVLVSVMRFIGEGESSKRWFFSDALWNPSRTLADPQEERLLSFGQAVEQGLIDAQGIQFHQIHGSRMFTARLTPSESAKLFDSWWPSTSHGFLAAVMTLPSFPAHEERVLEESGKLGGQALPYVSCIFRASRSFDHLGFSVLTRASSWASVREELTKRGWTDGTPIEFLPPLNSS